MSLIGPGLLLEGGKTNLVSTDDLTAWSLNNTPVITPGLADPAGGAAAYTIGDDDVASTEQVYLGVAFASDGSKALTVTYRESALATFMVSVYDVPTAVFRTRFAITFTGGTPTPSVFTGSGAVLGTLALAGGWFVTHFRADGIVAANANRVYLSPHDFTSATTGDVGIYRINVFDSPVPLGVPVAAGTAQAGDVAYLPFPSPPQAMQVYVRFIELGTLLSDPFGRVFHIGDGTTGGSPRLFVYADGGKFIATHDNGVSSGADVGLATGPAYGDVCELLLDLFADGSVQLHQSIGQGAVSSGVRSAGISLQGAWAGPRLYIGGDGSGTRPGNMSLLGIAVHAGNDLDIPYFRSLY